MKKTLLFIGTFLVVSMGAMAQKKSDLLLEIENLKSQLQESQDTLTKVKKSEKISLARTDAMVGQVTELQDANKSLLANLKNFTQVSKQNSTNMTKTLESLHDKEKQLKVMTESVNDNEAMALSILSSFKQTLGEGAKISVVNGAVEVVTNAMSLYGDAKNDTVIEAGTAWLGKIATVVNANPKTQLTIFNTNLADTDIAKINTRTEALQMVLQQKFGVAANRIVIKNTVGSALGTTLKIHPNFEQFYLMVRAGIKNNN